jgi:DUF1365 family protein
LRWVERKQRGADDTVTAGCSLYVGRVIHQRLRPRRHFLSYRSYWLLLDLDEIDALTDRLNVLSRNAFNLFSFRDRDHGLNERPLREQIESQLTAADIDLAGGRIRLLAMPRILGYTFNPLSIYFCHHAEGDLAAIVYEVHNTFHERHSYVLAVDPNAAGIHQHCKKRLYVSPFLGMDLRYDFNVHAPDAALRVVVRAGDGDGDLIVASLLGKETALTDAALLRLFLTHPLLTWKVTLGIHWEAMLLWLKGLRFYPRPPAPEQPVTPSTLRRAA